MEQFKVEGVVDLTWFCCHTYNVETYSVREFLTQEFGLPFIHMETDYSETDLPQLRVRIEAFLEMVDRGSEIEGNEEVRMHSGAKISDYVRPFMLVTVSLISLMATFSPVFGQDVPGLKVGYIFTTHHTPLMVAATKGDDSRQAGSAPAFPDSQRKIRTGCRRQKNGNPGSGGEQKRR